MNHPTNRNRQFSYHLLRGLKTEKLRTCFSMGYLFVFLASMVWLTGCQPQSTNDDALPIASPEKVAFSAEENGITHVKARGYEMNLEANKVDISVEGNTQKLAIHFENAQEVSQKEASLKTENEHVYRDLYEKTDLRFYDKGNGQAGYDFILEPGADPMAICMKLDGGQEPYLEAGELVQSFDDGSSIRHTAPIAYQMIENERVDVESAFKLEGDCLGFELGEYDSDYTLTIDPSVYRMMACAVSIDKVDVSGCYYYNGGSFATVSVEVGWDDPAAGNITVNLTSGAGNQTKTVFRTTPVMTGSNTPSGSTRPLYSPQVVAFEVPAGSSGNIDAFFTGTPGCAATQESFSAPAACPPDPCVGAPGTIGGKVFIDYNFDGIEQAGEGNGVADVTVTVYDCDGNAASAVAGSDVSDDDGFFYITGLNANTTYRLEFALAASVDGEITLGDSEHTGVQFVDAPSCDVRLGISSDEGYCQPDPKVMLPCFFKGNPLAIGGASGNMDAIIAFPYSASGPKNPALITSLATGSQVGNVWGLAYDRYGKKLYSSAFLRRHAGLGPLGLGGIYISDVASATTINFVDVASLSPSFDFGTIGSNSSRGLVGAINTPDVDATAFSLVGKVGIGDIDITPDGEFLYFTNLHDKHLYKMEVDADNNALTPPTASDVTRILIPDPGCTDGVSRPWAVRVEDGKVYVGVTCDASLSSPANQSDLRAFVYELDMTSGIFNTTPIFDFPLTYPKGSPSPGDHPTSTGWYPWSDDHTDYNNYNASPTFKVYAYPQPILGDIEFDIDGTMVLSILDRSGFQFGAQDYSMLGAGNFEYHYVGGDVLRAFASGGTFILENNAKAGPTSGSGVGNNQGPGFGEFYNDNFAYNGFPAVHAENVSGGLALRSGSGQVVVGTMDPTDGIIQAGGVRYLSNSTGLLVNSFTVYNNGNAPQGLFGKAAGIGDVELACDVLSAIEVGNRVWYDQNGDGVQDPCEPPLENVDVRLYDASGTHLATRTTSADGTYYFNSNDVAALVAGGTYFITFGDGQFAGGVITLNSVEYGMTKSMNATGAFATQIDSDPDKLNLSSALGAMPAGLPVVQITAPAEGEVDLSFDAGFGEPCDVEITIVSHSSCVANAFSTDVTINWANGPTTGPLQYSIDGAPFVDLARTNFDPDATGETFTLTGLSCNSSKIVEIRFKEATSCFEQMMFVFPPNDPAGYIYCSETGEVITGGTISVTPPAGGSFAIVTNGSGIQDGNDGRFEWVATGSPIQAGIYTMSYAPPAGYTLTGTPGVRTGDTDDLMDPTFGSEDNPTNASPLEIGSDVNGAGTHLIDFTAGANPFFLEFDLEANDPYVDLNNIPLKGCELCPTQNRVAFQWGDYPSLNESPTTTYPFVETITGAGGLDLDLTVTIPEAGSDDNRVGVQCGGSCQFPFLSNFSQNTDVYRYFRQNDNDIVRLEYNFSELIYLDTFITGGQRPPGGSGHFAYSVLTFWDGPNGTGNKVTSKRVGGPGARSFIPETGTATTALNVLTTGPTVQASNAFLSTTNEYVFVGYVSTTPRPWTVMLLDSVAVRSITWDLFVSAVDVSPDISAGVHPEGYYGNGSRDLSVAENPANLRNTGNVSAYISSFPLNTCAAPKFSLGNLVWKDLDADGTQDVGEPGIPGVDLKLEMYVASSNSYVDATDIDGAPVPNQTTDANGNYLFENLPDSVYRVVMLGSNWTSGVFSPTGACAGFEGTQGDGGDNQDNTDDNGDQNGVNNPTQIISQNIDLTADTEPTNDGDNDDNTDLSIDFGMVGYNLGNLVWLDADNSGDVNAADGASPGISGIEVELLDASSNPVDLDPVAAGTQSTTTTDANGYYLFQGVPAGTYRVRLTSAQFSGALNNHYPSTGANEEDNPDSDGDQNDNGLDPGDTGYAGDPSINGILSGVVTIGPADIEPVLEAPIPPSITLGDDGTDMPDNRSNQTVDFGLFQPVSVGDIVFVDTDGDGTQNSGTEPPLGGVTLKLLVNDGAGFVQAIDVTNTNVSDITTTNTGLYCFDDLPPGEYVVRVVGNGSGYEDPTTDGGDPDAVVDNDDNNAYNNLVSGFIETHAVDLVVGDEPAAGVDGDGTNSDKTVDIGFLGYSIGNYVWADNDGSGDVTAGDGANPGISGVTLELLDAAGAAVNEPGTASAYTTTTNTDGFYQFFGIPAGSYRVRVAASNFTGGLTGMYPTNGPNDEADADSDDDQDDNGLDNGDTGYPGVFGANGVLSGVVTLGGGVPEPTGETPTENGAAGNDNHGTPDANNNLTVDFGFYTPVEIGDLVWYDEDVDGMQDGLPNEPGIPGVALTIEVQNPSGGFDPAVDVNGTTVPNQNTNGSGNYCFGNLPPGTYRVAIVVSNWNAGQVFGAGGAYSGGFGTIGNGGDDGDNTDDNGDQDFIESPPQPIVSTGIQLIAGDESAAAAGGYANSKDPSIDFGISRGMAIGNRVWFDTDNNGELDGGELGANGVTVQLYEADIAGNPAAFVDEVTTCGGGYYLFPFLNPGDYIVVIPSSNFLTGGGLEGYHSSLTSMDNSGVLNETPAPLPNVDEDDNDDNGTKVMSGPFINAVRSGVITLDPTVGEPTNETDPSNVCVGGLVSINNMTNETIDFGFYRAAVGNLVWIDHDDNDGLYAPGTENGFGNVQVRLYAANGITEIPIGPDGILGTSDDATGGMLTSAAAVTLGEYCFNGLAEGDYVIKVTTPYGYRSSSGTNGSDVGTYEPGPDPDDNIDNDDNGSTGTAGNAGLVVADEVSLSAGNAIKANNIVDNSTGETKDATVDFGLYQVHAVGNHVFYDTDDSNSFDMGEQGADGVVVNLYDAATNTLVQSYTTANNGYYLFPFLQPGDYDVVIIASNFAPGGALACYHSTGISVNNSAVPSEASPADPDDAPGVDEDDNGAFVNAGPYAGGVASPTVTLNAAEPLMEPSTPGFNLPGQDPSPDAQGNYTVDFGFYKGLIGDIVFEDVDNDGERQLTEDGLGNVEVRLYAADGTTQIPAGPDGIVGSADDGLAPVLTSNAATTRGQYCFSGLPAGQFVVKVSVPAGYATSTGNNAQPTGPYEQAPDPDDNEDDDDNGSEEIIAGDTLATSLPVTLDPGNAGALNNNEIDDNNGTTKDPSVDIGLFPTFSLGNMVYFDTDNSASLDPGEQGVDGVTVELFYADGQGNPTGTALDTSTTVNGGYYCFAGLRPDEYVVVLIADNFDPATGVLRSHHSSGTSVDGNFVRSENPPAAPNLNIDGDDNGALNENPVDPFFGAVVSPVITLDWPLPAGEEAVNETPREPGKPEDTRDRQSNYTVDFGFYKTAVGDVVFDDNDNTGTINGGETGYPGGATVKICAADGVTPIPVGPDGVLGTADDGPTNPTTSSTGNFRFDGLPAGDYVIKLELPVGYVSSSGTNGNRVGPYEEPAPDADNGSEDNVDGDDNGTTTVQHVNPSTPGEVATLPVSLNPGDAGANANNVFTNPDGTTFDPTVDLGIYRVHSLGNVVFFDTDNSADQQATEVGADDVEVELFDNNGAFVDRDSTQSGGNYLFRYLAPAFQYRAVVTADNFLSTGTLWGYYSSATTIDGTGNIQETAANDPDADVDDRDDNGTFQIGGAYDGAVASELVTLGDGEPTNEPSDPTAGRPDPTTPDNQSNVTVDFGFYTGGLGNLVWDDTNNDGQFNGGEPRVPNQRMELYAADKTTKINVGPDGRLGTGDDTAGDLLTNANGVFRFRHLPEGNYYIILTPIGDFDTYISSTGTVGSPTGPYEPAPDPEVVVVNNDDNGEQANVPAVGGAPICTKLIALDPGNEPNVNNPTGNSEDRFIDLGIWNPLSIGNFVWEDDGPCSLGHGNNGMYDPSTEGPIDGVEMCVYYDANGDGVPDSGTPILTDITANGGFYLFDYLIEGNYVVWVKPGNFDPGAPLDSLISSTPTEVDPNDDIDNNDNGIDDKDRRNVGIYSGTITLVDDDEPENESPLEPVVGDGVADDDNSNMTVDFGFVMPGYFGDYVWDDRNHDGLQGDPADEPPVAGIVVRLYQWTGVLPPSPQADILIDTDITDANGEYYFEELPPCREYYVEFDNLPPDYELTHTNQGANDTIDSDPNKLTFLTIPTEIEPEEVDLTWDAGIFLPKASIGDLVWDDLDEDGYQEAGEPGVQGIRVVLHNCNGDSLDQTFTDVNGRYEFTELIPGDYYVVFKDLPADYEFTLKDQDPNDVADSDADAATGVTACTHLDPDEDDPNWDAGIYIPKASLGDKVFHDEDEDGAQDPNEPGVPNVKVVLHNCVGDSITETFTDAQGFYLFDQLLPGDYYVVFSDLPADWDFTGKDNVPNDDVNDSDANANGQTDCTHLDPHEDERDVDAGIYLPYASIGDKVWEDLNENGIQDPGEPGVPGVHVVLNRVGSPIGHLDTTQTDINGRYYFDEVTPGDYCLIFYQIPTDYVASPQNVGNDGAVDSDPDPITFKTDTTTLDPHEDDPSWDLGIYLPKSSLGDKVFEDEDEDGVQDPTEPGVQNIRVVLYTCNGDSMDQDFTDVNGEYNFDELTPGDYYVIFNDIPAGYSFSPKDAASSDALDSDADQNGQTACTHLDPGEDDPTVDAGIYEPKASIGDCVWYDENENGVQDPGESGVAGILVKLYDGNGTFVAQQNTNNLGKYLFDELTPGDYYVNFSMLPLDWVFSPKDTPGDDELDSDVDPINGRTATTTLDPDEDDLSWDAGIYIPRASLGDRVWDDVNENGAQDPGEEGVEAVKVYLHDCTGTLLDSTMTDVNGNYLFDQLIPGDFYVVFDLPTDYVFTPQDNLGGDDVNDSDADENSGQTACTHLDPLEDERDVDAGIYLPKATLGDKVFEDDDKDGEQDPTEDGVQGIRVVLHNCAGDSIDQDITDANGEYLFDNLIPGDYYVVFKDLPAGYGFSPQDAVVDTDDSDADQNGVTGCTHLDPGEEDRTHDAGIIPPTAELGDFVWEDIDEDGQQDSDEPPVPNVRVVLHNCNGDSLDQQFTDANGFYLFTNLAPGDYYIVFKDIPADYEFTNNDQGDDNSDSDADANGQSACIHLDPGESDRTPDAGIRPEKLKVCEAEEFAPNGFAMIFTSGTYPGANPHWNFDANGGEFTSYLNGTARLTGTVVNQADANLKYCVELRLKDKRDWGEWTALGHKVKAPQNGPSMSWEFFEVDSLHSRLVGKGTLDGDTMCLSHEPINRDYGFQYGDGANAKNAAYGLGGWFRFVEKATGNVGTGDFNVNLESCVDHNPTPIAPQLGAIALLQGPYNQTTGLMRADLKAQGILPNAQPFNTSPWNYAGTEVVGNQAPDSIVDWVLVELRDVNNFATVLSRQAGLLLQGGQVVQSDGHSLLEMPQGISTAHLVIYNWNHLPVMSAHPIQKYGNVFFYDLTDGMNSVYRDLTVPNMAAASVPGGIVMLFEGDASGDGQINSLDLGQVMQQYFMFGSSTQDINLDGVINSLDIARSMRNYFIRSHVPK